MDTPEKDTLQSVCTVSQMAEKVNLSRARLYQLIDSGVFPPPVYCCSNEKPVYPHQLQDVCLKIRKTGIGFNGQITRFYSRRKKRKHRTEYKHITTILRRMGLSVSISQVTKAAQQLCLSAPPNEPIRAETVRRLFEHLCSQCQKDV